MAHITRSPEERKARLDDAKAQLTAAVEAGTSEQWSRPRCQVIPCPERDYEQS